MLNAIDYIFLKVSRDRALKSWKFLEQDIKKDYGSGYPSGELLFSLSPFSIIFLLLQLGEFGS